MPWTKDETSEAPKTIYFAPPEAYPIVMVIRDPEAEYHWSVVYAHLSEVKGVGGNDLKADIEAIMEM